MFKTRGGHRRDLPILPRILRILGRRTGKLQATKRPDTASFVKRFLRHGLLRARSGRSLTGRLNCQRCSKDVAAVRKTLHRSSLLNKITKNKIKHLSSLWEQQLPDGQNCDVSVR